MVILAEEGKVSAVDRLTDQLRGLIRERRLGIGDALPTERELEDRFGASRNTIREALQVLKAYGMIEVRPKVGAIIIGGREDAVRKLFAFHQEISPSTFMDVQGFRRIVEIGVGDQIIQRATGADFDLLDEINARILSVETAQEAAACDYALHEAMVALAGNRTTVMSYRFLQPVIEQIMLLGKAEQPAQQIAFEAHAEIVAALRARDRAAFAYLLGKHLEYGQKYLDEPAD